MSLTAQQLVEELQIFGLECEEAVTEKCESLAPSPDLSLALRLERKGERFHGSPTLSQTSRGCEMKNETEF